MVAETDLALKPASLGMTEAASLPLVALTAWSDLVKAGLLRRHYQGFRVDHPNRGAQREAVYTVLPEVRRALARH